jgi:hypothetical protein
MKKQFALINRAQETDQFLTENSSLFKSNAIIPFENIGSDTIKEIVIDELTKISLGQQLGLLVTQDCMLQAVQSTKEVELKGAKGLVDVYLQSPTQGHTTSPIELVQDLQNTLDLIKCQRVKVGSQITTLKHLGINAIMPPKPEEQTSTPPPPQHGTVLYNYTPMKPDELEAFQGDEIEILESEKEGWVKIKHTKSGNQGLLPAAYVHIIDTVTTTHNDIIVAIYGTHFIT